MYSGIISYGIILGIIGDEKEKLPEGIIEI